MSERRTISTPKAPIMPVPISQAVAHGSTLYVGGQAGFDPATRQLISDRFEDQLRQALANLQAVVQAAGSSLDRALKVTVYVARMEDYAELNTVYAEFFCADPPARKVIQCQLLPGLLAEVDAIVALAQGESEEEAIS